MPHRARSRSLGGAVPAVDRALRILQALARSPHRLTELARSLDLPKSTTLAILRTLQHHRAVAYDSASGRYSVGSGLLAIAGAAHGDRALYRAARAVIARLAEVTGETVILHVPDDGGSVVADREESRRQLRVAAPLGYRLPPFAGAVAKAMLAFSGGQSPRIPRGLPRFTPRSISSRAGYLRELQRTRERGYATDDEEYLLGVRAASAPVIGPNGSVAAILSIVGVKSRLPVSRLRQFGRLVREGAQEVSGSLAAEVPLEVGRASHG